MKLLKPLKKYLQVLIKFDYKIIFVFSDPAGGNIISSLIDRALEEKKDPGRQRTKRSLRASINVTDRC